MCINTGTRLIIVVTAIFCNLHALYISSGITRKFKAIWCMCQWICRKKKEKKALLWSKTELKFLVTVLTNEKTNSAVKLGTLALKKSATIKFSRR